MNNHVESLLPLGPRNKSADAEGRSVRDRASAYMCDNPTSLINDSEPKNRRSSDSPKKVQSQRKSESQEIVHVSVVSLYRIRSNFSLFIILLENTVL